MPMGRPDERVGLDVIGLLPPTERGHRYIQVMVDYFTKAVEAELMKAQDAETVAQVLVYRWIC